MTGTRYIAEHLITMAPTASTVPEVHSPGTVDVADGRVVWSGATSEAPVTDWSTAHVSGVLLPGLVNIHAHTPMMLLRGTGEGLPTDRWLTDVMWPREGRLTADDVRWAMRFGATELLRNGVTTSSEMYFHADAVASGAADASLRCVVASPFIEAADFAGLGPISDQVAALRELAHRWTDHPTVEIAAGPHAAYSLSRDALAAVSACAHDEGLLVHIHLAEQPHEATEVERRTGMTVPAYLDSLGLLGPRTVAAHSVWVTDADIELMAARGVGVAHCPCSNGRHASGIAPVAKMRRAGIKVGIATDGPASHDRLDMFEDVRTAARYARIVQMDASQLSAAELLAMVTSEAADALGRADLGRLTAGSRADMIAMDHTADGFEPVLDPADLIGRVVWAGTGSAVRDVWVGGRHVVVNGSCITTDRQEARQRVVEIARRLAG
jgi:5-methylthioadenosine/S-adenosylhomocysteine deaminase